MWTCTLSVKLQQCSLWMRGVIKIIFIEIEIKITYRTPHVP